MRRPRVPLFRPLSPLAISELSEQVVRLRSVQEAVEIRVLAPDLFRIRIAQGRNFSDRPSWAVAKHEWEPVPTKIRTSRTGVSVKTDRGNFLLQLAGGSW